MSDERGGPMMTWRERLGAMMIAFLIAMTAELLIEELRTNFSYWQVGSKRWHESHPAASS